MSKLLFLLASIVFFANCSRKDYPVLSTEKQEVKEQMYGNDLIGLASPIQLLRGNNIIRLEDYFLEASIDKINSDIGLPFVLDASDKVVTLNVDQVDAPLSNLELYSGSHKYDILVKRPNKKKNRLKLENKNYQSVQIKGEMNAWDPAATQVNLVNNEWITELELNSGNYQYKYIVDGKEINDPANPTLVSNGSGGHNSLLVLEKPKKENLPWLNTESHTSSNITLTYTNVPSNIYAYWENTLLVSTIGEGKVIVPIPGNAKTQDRSRIRVMGYNEHGLSNDILIPLQNGVVLYDPNDLKRTDHEAQIMYFTLVDRFHNGDTANDDPIDDTRLKPLTNYEGGDLRGIIAKIKSGYFSALNINSIWLSPITQNPLVAYQEYISPQYFYSGYHGYWPISSSEVDHRFGDEETLQELVDVAHEHDINILLDYVTNHVHEDHPIYKNHPEWATPLVLPDGSKNLRIWDAQRLTTWFDEFMPSLDLSNPKVIDLQVDSTIYWIKKYGIDGYRHDATKHIPLAFWTQLTRQLKEEVIAPEGRSLYQIGETYGSRDLISSYISSGMLDAQFDFNLYFDSREVFALQETSFDKLVSSLEETFSYYGYHSSMGYITGNHDQARFISLASGDVSFSEDHKMAGFDRDIVITDSLGYDKLEMLISFVMSIPGVPVIYYGDEIGMPGAGDPDSRRMMRFEELAARELETKSVVKKLTELRTDNLALTYGDTDIVSHNENTMVLRRRYFDKEVLLVMNKSLETKTVDVPTEFPEWEAHMGQEVSSGDFGVSVTLQPWKFEILTR